MPDFKILRGLLAGPAVLALALAPIVASGANVPDPTRPAVATVAAEDEAGEVRVDAPVLQSTLISPSHRSAIISGRAYRVGDTVGDARLEAIGPGWVRLATPTGRSELRLSYPNTTRPVNR